MPIADILLISALPFQSGQLWKKDELPLSKQVEVAPGIQFAGIRPEIVAAVLCATRFRGPDTPDKSALYGFVRYDPPGNSWDQDQAISKALFLSHFVHPHEGGFEFTARIETDDRGKLVRLEPADIAPPFARAYCCVGVQRRWLTQADALDLKNLIGAYTSFQAKFPRTRVALAVSLFSESPFVFHGRPRGLLLTTTLEGLVSTSAERAVKQFTTRVPALATEVGLTKLNATWAARIYKLRSKLAHGTSILQSVDDHERQRKMDEFNVDLTDLDELLRRLLGRALTDADFLERLENAHKYWPVPGKGCPTCQTTDSELLVVSCPRCGASWW